MQELGIFAIVAMLIFIAPLIHKITKLSLVVVEILLGALVLNVGIIGEIAVFKEVAHIGFLFLMFLAGIEVDIKSFLNLGVSFLRKVTFYFIALYASSGIIVLAFDLPLIYAVAFPVMSIGMIVILMQEVDKDKFWLNLALKIGIIGEIISISMLVLLNGYHSFGIGFELYFSILILFIFSVVVGVIFKISDVIFWWLPNLRNVLIPAHCEKNEDIRYAMMLFFLMITIVHLLNIEVALGAFVSGVIISNFFKTHKSLHHRLNDIGFGFLIPLFFVYIGSTLDFSLIDFEVLKRAIYICIAMIAVRIVASLVAFYRDLKDFRHILLFVLGSAMPLTFLVATATLGLNIGALEKGDYYAFVLSAMIEAVVFVTIIKAINARV
ncbi:cation:proton antiporter [Helicobacter sp. 23-1044]